MTTKGKSPNHTKQVIKYLKTCTNPGQVTYSLYQRKTGDQSCKSSSFSMAKQKYLILQSNLIPELLQHFASLTKQGQSFSGLSCHEYQKLDGAIKCNTVAYFLARSRHNKLLKESKTPKSRVLMKPVTSNEDVVVEPRRRGRPVGSVSKPRKYTLYQTIYSRDATVLGPKGVEALRDFVQVLVETSRSKLEVIELLNPHVVEIREFN